MALLKTPEPQENFIAPNFNLKNIDSSALTYDDVKGENGTVIAFICNHCPYVKAIIERFVADMKDLQGIGIGVAAIMPNDTDNYPEDSFENMQKFADQQGFSFPYLLDETQEVAKAYGAVCTPDLYGFNKHGELQYRGRLDSAGPNEPDGEPRRELVHAMKNVANSGTAPAEQQPSMGCSIKWK